MLGGIFAPTRRATNHEVILKVVVFIKPFISSFLIPQWGIYIKGECFKENLFDSSGPSGKQRSVGRWIEVGQVWSGGVMDPSLYHSATQICAYLRRKLEPTAIPRGGGVIHTGSYHCVPGPPPPQSLLPPPSPPLQGVPRGGNKQPQGAQLK